MQFVIRGGGYVLKEGFKFIAKQSARGGAATVKQSARAMPEYARGLAGAAPRAAPVFFVRGSDGVARGVAYGAGVNQRAAVSFAVRNTVGAVRGNAASVAKYAVRSTVRDTLSPYYGVVQSYRLFRDGRVFRGATSRLERGIDTYVERAGRFLARGGLEPTLLSVPVSSVRIALVASVYENTKETRGRLSAVGSAIADRADSVAVAIQRNSEALRGSAAQIEQTPALAPTVRLDKIPEAPIVPAPAPAPRPPDPVLRPIVARRGRGTL